MDVRIFLLSRSNDTLVAPDQLLKRFRKIIFGMGSKHIASKKAQTTLRSTYFTHFKFRHPLQILPDTQFLEKYTLRDVDIRQELEELSGGQVKLFTTNCVLQELRSQKLFKSLELAKQCEILRHCCGTPGKSPSQVCLVRCTNMENRYKYCVAAQSEELRSKLKSRVVPTFYVDAGGTLQLAAIDASVEQRVKKITNKLLHVSSEEKKLLQSIAPVEQKSSKFKGKKKPKGPNPLSMKKKK